MFKIKLPTWLTVLLLIVATPFAAVLVIAGYILITVANWVFICFSWPWKVLLAIPLLILGGGKR